ncbi:hypothetical protein [Serinicoccus marinus]|uniref:hypothetical protein n=1 Tax=Serinicoccus marinus TaxID=247333 RepID=UPI0024914EED|nr:hypothetical protein [Serinicoccus marinus]
MTTTARGRGGARPGAGRRRALTVEQVREARAARALPPASRPSLADLAERLDVGKSTVHAAVRGLPPYDRTEYGRPPAETTPPPPGQAPVAPPERFVHSSPWAVRRDTRGRWARG